VGSIATVANIFNAFNGNGRGSANFTMKCTSEGDSAALAAVTLTSANDFDSAYDLFPIGFYSTTASHRGRHGTLFDAYLGNSTVADGDTYPNDAANRQWVQVGTGLVLPWGIAATAPVRT
jgi:hypothetical protein